VPAGKLTSLADAVAKWVPDGCSVALCTSLESLIPFAAGHEIIRQRKRDLTLIGPISDILFDQIIGGGCAGKVEAAWVGNVITGSAYRFRQAVECGAVEMVDHSNLTLAMGLKAGALGVPYLPVRTALGSDLVSRGRHFAKIACPFSGQPLCAVKAICPDAAIVHVQQPVKRSCRPRSSNPIPTASSCPLSRSMPWSTSPGAPTRPRSPDTTTATTRPILTTGMTAGQTPALLPGGVVGLMRSERSTTTGAGWVRSV